MNTPWQQMARTIGRALGRAERAEELIAEVEALFADARAEHPEFEGATVVPHGTEAGPSASTGQRSCGGGS